MQPRLVLIGGIGIVTIALSAVTLLANARGDDARVVIGTSAAAIARDVPELRLSGTVIWGKIPSCSCIDSPGVGPIVAQLKEKTLPTTVQELSTTSGWLYFAITFDPSAASRDDIEHEITV